MAKVRIEPYELTAERIRTLRQEKGWSQKALAEKIGKTEQMMRRYEHGDTGLSNALICEIAKLFWVPADYLRGLTECKSYAEYARELDKIDDAALKEYEEAQKILPSFFSAYCGYHFIRDPYFDFADLIPEEHRDKDPRNGIPGPFRLSKSGGSLDVIVPGKDFFFTQEELDSLIKKVKDLIDFECYKKLRKEEES